ncbi:hypothetical protein A4212_10005 [Pasteurella multocida]|uniref:hypothetical protein n=1 Tax=Pasteurella multocida TaxID=747 RepID=UPI00094B0F0B|nr:hypothetical protein [Pasteurella multocida]AUK45189.1 hypothetical protein A4212_08295 [Pasteurella multocida]AUK45508.1 hypothetical protein A4212_10005 [Pasteurella multocida]HEH9695003.1 hypothetical protein [Pasteurella multocida]HEH9706214.1 hypothetical protein [Pasteurella multocida]HEH9720101.1 hypothetical protein [Pasteurella multocida]
MRKLVILSLGFISCFALANVEQDNQKLAEDFCYAVQASGSCSDLNMRLDTEGKVNALVGEEIRKPNGKYSESCFNGLKKANNDKKLCSNAWKKFGCNGSVTARLLQTNPFTNKDGAKCTF